MYVVGRESLPNAQHANHDFVLQEYKNTIPTRTHLDAAGSN